MTTEKRLIDADALVDVLENLKSNRYGWAEYNAGVESAVYAAENAPTVDAVEVVRCMNCTYWKRHTKVDKYYGACFINRCTKHENGFCDRGERRTDARL